jgi:hypothetical protein
MPKDPTKPDASKEDERQPTLEEKIRHRAFELYEEHGRDDGHELDNWLEAEREVLEEAA